MPSQLASRVAGAVGQRLNEIGFERTRRALAGLALSLFVSLYLLVALNAPEGLGAVVRWRSPPATASRSSASSPSGSGGAGSPPASAGRGSWSRSPSLAMVGWTPVLAIYGGAARAGRGRADRARRWPPATTCRRPGAQRYKMDEFGVARLRKTVTRAAASLPSLILWALGPEGGRGWLAVGGAGGARCWRRSACAASSGCAAGASWPWRRAGARGGRRARRGRPVGLARAALPRRGACATCAAARRWPSRCLARRRRCRSSVPVAAFVGAVAVRGARLPATSRPRRSTGARRFGPGGGRRGSSSLRRS